MAFKQWQDAKNTKQIPWAEQYVKEHPGCYGTLADVRYVKLKLKGVVVETDSFAVWIYRSKSLHDYLVQFIEQWYAAKQASPILQIMLTAEEPYWTIGVDDERTGGWSKGREENYWHQHYSSVEDNPSASSNPLPLPSSPSSVQEQARASQSTPSIEELVDLPSDLPLEASANGMKPAKGRNTRKGDQDAL